MHRAGHMTQVHLRRGSSPAVFVSMRELSVFIGESGDFSGAVGKLNHALSDLGLDNVCIHTGPIIRREEIYEDRLPEERRFSEVFVTSERTI